MIPYASLHNHTNFADGKHSPDEMVEAAYRAGFACFGISEHATMDHAPEDGLKVRDMGLYESIMRDLQAQYKGKMDVAVGIEQDIFGRPIDRDYDYIIGSVHFVKKDGKFLCIDRSPELFDEHVQNHFGGDVYAMVEEYFATVARVHAETGCHIIGHFDLITKFNENGIRFDVNHPRVQAAAKHALDRLIPTGAIFEINTGAITRGYRKSPYPDESFLRVLNERGAKIILSADAHHKDWVPLHFDLAAQHAKHCGYKTVMTWKDGAFVEVEL